MKQIIKISSLILLLATSSIIKAQDTIVSNSLEEEPKLKISGELMTDDRFLLKNKNNWA